ncbi:MAG TPA: histidine kinase [Acidiferrobacterales bacterium]|nr:histidine kinase [Acidiferrobacterales bacterium]
MAFDTHKLSAWSLQARGQLTAGTHLLRDRLLPRVADSTGRLLRLFAPAPATAADDTHFLPNFCRGRAIGGIVLIAELLAIVITLVTRRISTNLFQDLLLVSLFVQWIALSGAATLCMARRFLDKLPNSRALGFAYLLLLAVVLVVSEAAVWVLWLTGAVGSPRPEWYAYFHIQNFTVAAIINALALRYFLARHQLRQRTLSEARAKIEVLRSRIRPHFLFNTMNIIASLIRSAPDKAETAVVDMADLFRTMLGDSENLVPVSNEIAIAKKYLDIEALRLDNRLRVDWNVGKFPRKAVMPVLVLQPLLENAIQHGIEPIPTGGVINVRLWEENDIIHILVTNPLPRLRSKTPMTPLPSEHTLDNLRLRLESHYGDAARFEITQEPERFSVAVQIPIRGGNP